MTLHIGQLGGRRKRQGGFAIVSAVFLVIVLAVLGAAIANIATTQQASSTLDVQGARAYQAARAGIEWGAFQWLRNTSCVAATSFVPPAPTLQDFTVTVNCTQTTTFGITMTQITSTACNFPVGGSCPGTAGAAYYVERQLQVKM